MTRFYVAVSLLGHGRASGQARCGGTVREGWQISLDVLRQAAEWNGATIVGPPHGLDD